MQGVEPPTQMACVVVSLFVLVSTMQATAVEVNIAIDGDFKDWADIPVLIEDPDDVGEDNGDIKAIRVYSTEDTLYAMLTVYGTAAPQDNQRSQAAKRLLWLPAPQM